MDSSTQAPADDQVEYSRFAKLHEYHTDQASLFSDLVRRAGLEKVRDYLNRMEAVFNDSPSEAKLAFALATQNHIPTALTDLQKEFPEQGKQLLRLAYFHRYPECSAPDLSDTDIVTALEAPIPSVGKSSTTKSVQPAWADNIVKEGFHAEYKKSDLIVAPHLNLLRSWAKEWSDAKYKAPYTSIIGPTMSGKTRLLMELGKHVCVVYICLRPHGSSGQPPRSSLASLILDEQPDLHVHYSCFLAAILEVVAEFFTSRSGLHNPLTAWSDYSFQLDDKQNAGEFSSHVREKMKVLFRKPSDSITLVHRATSKMYDSIKFIPQGQLKVLLAIDEARHLIEHQDQNLNISYFRVLRRVLSQIPPSKGFFAVFTDTTSKVANFSPSLDRDPSLRTAKRGHELYQPIYKLSTLDLMVKPLPTSWKELLSPLRLFSYGSPFYSLYFEKAIKMLPETAIEETLRIAQSKLLCRLNTPSPEELEVVQIFALLGSTIQTRFASSEMNSELVSSHAAHCMFISPSRELIVSNYPSQFVYASASNAFLALKDQNFIICIQGLAAAMQNGLISRGDAGEMATRIILLRAMHKTKPIPCAGQGSIPYGYSVRLADFLQTLTGKDPHTLYFGPIAIGDKKRLLKQGRIFFNHFIRIKFTPNRNDFMEFLYRGLAIQCKPGQHGLDQLFTIYLAPESPSHTLSLKNITFCGIQTKNQKDSIDWRNSYKWSKTGAGIPDISNPYLILLFSLRWKGTGQDNTWTKPTHDEDTQRAYLQFLGLDAIACLTLEIRTALRRLVDSMQEDIMQLHKPKPDDTTTVEWVKCLNPMFYSESERIDVYPKPPQKVHQNKRSRQGR